MHRLSNNGSEKIHVEECGSRGSKSQLLFENITTSSAALTSPTLHPHGCGERIGARPAMGKTGGSSPRVWGTHNYRWFLPLVVRFIPTGVGNATIDPLTGGKTAVHPHGCGERFIGLKKRDGKTGSSPRVWGTPSYAFHRGSKPRFIPTGVGNACRSWALAVRFSVHPHGCGERLFVRKTRPFMRGSSPRVWGTRPVH